MTMSVKDIARACLNWLPRSEALFRLCRHYVNRYRGENNADMETNGEGRWLREVAPDCSVVFDVGANVGDFTAAVLRENPQIFVHSFEPTRAAFAVLGMRSFGSNVKLNQMALSDTPGEAVMHLFGDASGINSLERREGLSVLQDRQERVVLDTLDRYCDQRGIAAIDLLKIDVEGHELRVLRGATRMLTEARVKRIQFEYGGTYIDSRTLLKDVFDLLVPLGYVMCKVFPDSLVEVERYSQELENFQYQNWVALRVG